MSSHILFQKLGKSYVYQSSIGAVSQNSLALGVLSSTIKPWPTGVWQNLKALWRASFVRDKSVVIRDCIVSATPILQDAHENGLIRYINLSFLEKPFRSKALFLFALGGSLFGGGVLLFILKNVLYAMIILGGLLLFVYFVQRQSSYNVEEYSKKRLILIDATLERLSVKQLEQEQQVLQEYGLEVAEQASIFGALSSAYFKILCIVARKVLKDQRLSLRLGCLQQQSQNQVVLVGEVKAKAQGGPCREILKAFLSQALQEEWCNFAIKEEKSVDTVSIHEQEDVPEGVGDGTKAPVKRALAPFLESLVKHYIQLDDSEQGLVLDIGLMESLSGGLVDFLFYLFPESASPSGGCQGDEILKGLRAVSVFAVASRLGGEICMPAVWGERVAQRSQELFDLTWASHVVLNVIHRKISVLQDVDLQYRKNNNRTL